MQIALQERTVQVPIVAERVRIPFPLVPTKFGQSKTVLNKVSANGKRHREGPHILRRVRRHVPAERTTAWATNVVRNRIRIHAIESEFHISKKAVFRLQTETGPQTLGHFRAVQFL